MQIADEVSYISLSDIHITASPSCATWLILCHCKRSSRGNTDCHIKELCNTFVWNISHPVYGLMCDLFWAKGTQYNTWPLEDNLRTAPAALGSHCQDIIGTFSWGHHSNIIVLFTLIHTYLCKLFYQRGHSYNICSTSLTQLLRI